MDWEKKVVSLCATKPAPDLGDLAKFVDKVARAKNNPFYRKEAELRSMATDIATNENEPSETPPLLAAATNITAPRQSYTQSEQQQTQSICPTCSIRTDHFPNCCPSFLKMEKADRMLLARRTGLCFICCRKNCN